MESLNEYDLLAFEQMLNKIQDKIPNVNSSKDYWFIRANKGEFYESFLLGGYIAIGWNFITLEDLEQLDETAIKSRLKEHDRKMEKPGSAYNQMMRFAYQIQIGDIVIVPSQAPNDLLVGEVKSKPYTEKDEIIEDASNVCPYNKRINVEWLGVIRNKDIDPQLFKLVYAGHTVSDANSYKKYINRGLYDVYIDGNEMSMTFKVQEEENINAFAYSTFLHHTLSMTRILQENLDSHKQITLRTNVQSKGPIEFLGDPAVLLPVMTFLTFMLAGYNLKRQIKKNGGKIEIDFKTGKANIEVNSEGDEKIKKATANLKNAEAIEKLLNVGAPQELIRAALELDLDPPQKAKKIIDGVVGQPEQLEFEETDE
ncbi:hypothetical protein [Streptococcus suis]